MSMFVACKEATVENGATRFIPGSHLWDYSVPPPVDNRTAFYAELKPGDCLMMLAGVYHGGSANRTKQERLVMSAFAIRGYLRQEENQYIAHDPEKIKRLPVWLQRFVGYNISEPYVGLVEQQDPLRVLNPDVGDFLNPGY